MNTKRVGIIVVVLLILSLGIFMVASSRQSEPTNTMANQEPEQGEPTKAGVQSSVAADEKATIDAWIAENDLNDFGDPKDTVYAGGTPLFNESTGEYTDKYEYILKQHPDKPWNN